MWLWWGVAAGAASPVVQMDDRVELELVGYDDVRAVACGDRGAVVVAVDEQRVELTQFDTSLRAGWTASWTSPGPFRVAGVDVDDTDLWLLLHWGKSTEVQLLRADLRSGDVSASTLRVPVPAIRGVKDLVLSGGEGWFIAQTGAMGLQGPAGTLVYLPDAASPLGVPAPEATRGSRTYVHRLSRDRDRSVHVTLSTSKRRVNELYVGRLEGTRIDDVRRLRPAPEDGRNWLDGQQVHLPDGREWLVGTWASGENGQTSQGLFVAPVVDGEVGGAVATSFLDLHHFFDHLSEAQRARVTARIERKRSRGSEVALGYRISVQDVVIVEGQPAVVAEASLPQYETRTRTVTNTVNGVMTTTTQSYQVFVGWRFTHAIAVAFGPDGAPVWDASVPMGDILSFDLRPRVRAAVEGDRITLSYVANGRFSSRAFVNGVEVEATTQARIETEAGERVLRGWAERTELWGDQAFLVSGFQKVDDPTGRRRVFALARVEP